ncbi:MAG: hypothetical protein ABIE22_00425 [archaeon]
MILLANIILIVVVLFSAIPVGYLIAWLARDELEAGKRWFWLIMIVGELVIIFSSIIGISGDAVLGTFYLVVMAFIALIKSGDKEWTKARI